MFIDILVSNHSCIPRMNSTLKQRCNVCVCVFGGESYRGRKRVTKVFHLLAHAPNDDNGQAFARLKLQGKNYILVSYKGGRSQILGPYSTWHGAGVT